MTSSSSAFQSQLTAVAAETESLLERLMGNAVLAGERARPAHLMEAMRYVTLGGGKRVRPFLVAASAALFDVPRERALMVGAALECVHCYSLARHVEQRGARRHQERPHPLAATERDVAHRLHKMSRTRALAREHGVAHQAFKQGLGLRGNRGELRLESATGTRHFRLRT